MSISWSDIFAHAEPLPLPTGLEDYFGVGRLELVRKHQTVFMLCAESTDTLKVVPLAKAIDPQINASSWGGDLIIGFHADAYESFVAHAH